MNLKATSILHCDSGFPARLRERLADAAPAQLTTLGSLDLLALPKTGLFCSARCPGNVILSAYDQAARWRDEGRCIISGFHSPVEKECLRILMRGTSPVIICPARALPKRLPSEWKTALDSGRLLLLSAFPETKKRITATLAIHRNKFVAALADEAYFPHISPGGHAAHLTTHLARWHVPFFDSQSAG